jgi:di/tricarboxylate transporter
MEVVALSATTFLLLFGIISPEEAVSGFSNKAVITIGAMFIMSKALLKTGFLEVLTEKVYLFAGQKKWLTVLVFFMTVAIISGFINNTAAVAIFIPLAIYLGQLMHISPTKLLMPLSFAAIFGGTLTLIGTSTNLLVSSIMVEKGIKPFSIFEFFQLGIIFLIVGTIYNVILAKWFLPSRVVISSLTKKYHMARYLTEFKISEDSSLLGKTINQLDIEDKFDIQILMIIRDQVRYRYNLNTIHFKKDDVILVQINIKDIISLKEKYNLLLLSDVKMTQEELSGKNHVLVECLLPQESHLIGKTLQELDFRKKYQGFVLAVRRNTDIIREKLAKIKLRFSDTLLVMMPKGKVENFRSSPDLILLEELNIALKYEGLWWLSIIVIPLIMILTFINVISIMKASIIGAVILLIVRSLSIQDAYESINWSVIFLIASLIPIGIAIDKTGTDLLIGKLIISIGDLFNANMNQEPHLYLAILYIATVLFSAFISNNAIAVIMAPVAIAIAINLNVDPRPFMVAVCFAASNCFMTPIGYQTNLMVYGPGQYKFSDFIKAGLPLTLIFWLISVYFIPIFWPF